MVSYSFLKGYGTELFYGNIACKDEAKNTVRDVELFKLDMTRMIWERVEDLKDAIFFKEDTCESVFYRPATVSELGGYIHIVGEMGKVIYSFNIKNRTISVSSMPRLVQESQVSVWVMLECRLEVDTEQEQEDKDGEIVVNPVNVEGESHLLNIPVPILEMIMELCIGVEYMKFRATCKQCHLAAPAIQWNNKTMLKRLQMYSLVSPWLMVWDKNQGVIIFTDPIYGDKYFIKIPQELSDIYMIYYSRFGWLLMYEFSRFLVFFNPFTGDIREVLPEAPYFDSLCFSAPPTFPDCMVVGCSPDGCVYIHFVAGEPSWRRFVMSIDGHNPYFFNFPTLYGGDLYVLRDGGGVEVFRELGGNLSRECVVAKGPKSCCRDPTQYFLADCNQQFFLVIMGEFGESIEVFRPDDFKKEWEKIDSIGNHMIYICDTTCLCIESKTREMGNKIYFARLSNLKNEKIVFYSLETCRYHTFNGKNIQETFGDDLFETKHHCYPHMWVEPSWS